MSLKTEIRDLFNKIEKYVQLEKVHLYFTSDISTYDFVIIKTDSEYMDYFCQELNIPKKKYSKKSFFYENGYYNIENYIIDKLSFNIIGLIVKVPLFKKWDSEGKNLFKVYGFHLMMQDEGLIVTQLTSQKLVEAYSIDCITKEPLKLPINNIFCGEKEDDVICGFDLS